VTAALPGPVAAAANDHTPCPRVQVTITPAGGVSTATLWRTDPAGTTVVRGGYRVTLTGPALVTDYEAPFGVTLTYTAVGYDAAGTAGPASPPSAPVTLADPVCPWLAAALVPATARQVTPFAWSTRKHTRENTVLWPVTGDAAIVLANTRPRPSSDLGLVTDTDAQAADLLAMLEAPTLVWRPPSTWGWSGGHVYAADVTEDRHKPKTAADPRRLWTFTLIPVRTPDPTLVENPTTWAQVYSFYPTWAALPAAKATWLDVQRNPDPGGA
jgi:hypothetical protein